MALISAVWGLAALVLMAVAFIPMFGFLNWFVIPFAAVGVALGYIAKSGRPQDSGQGKTGFFCAALALCLSIFRLIIGGGIF